jgi:hypothetical protein
VVTFVCSARVAVIAVTLLGLVHAPAHASANKTALLVSGTATPHQRELAASTIEAIARDAGAPVAKASFSAKEATTIAGCVTAPQAWNCVASVIRGRGLEQVAIVSLVNDTSPDSSPMVIITEQIIVMNLDTAISAQRFCVRCTDDVLVNVTSELTRTMFQDIAVRSGRTVVTITSTPRGARLVFDGNSIGATDRSFSTFPGKHTVELELDGYRRESRAVEAALDKTSVLSVTMRPLNAPPEASADGHRDAQPAQATPLAPKLAVGAGALAVIAGVIVFALDEKSLTAPKGTEQRRQYYDTTVPGIALVVGGVIAGVGGYLGWRHTRSTVAPVVAPMPGGVTVGLTKVF